MNHDRDTETLDNHAPADAPTDAPADAREAEAPEPSAPADEAAEAAEVSDSEAASPEAESESEQAEEESGPEASVDADDDSEAEAAADGSSAEAAEDVSPEAAGAEAEEEAAEDDAGQGPEAESPAEDVSPEAAEVAAEDEEAPEDSGQAPEAAGAEAEEEAAEDDAGQAPEAEATEAPDPQAAIAESEDPEAAARAVFGLQGKEEEEELKPEEAAAILAPAEEEEEPEVEEEVTLADADLVDVYEEEVSEPSPYDRAGDWYVVHTYSGYEKKVKSNLETRVKSLHLEGRIHEVSIPMDDVIEFKGGKKTVVQKKVFPGYLLVRMTLDDETWGAVRNTPGVTGFVGGGAKPTPLSRKEVESILRVRPEDEAKKARPRLEFEVGDQVQVKTGPFADFNGLIDEINVDQSTLKVLVNIFGRETPVTLDFADVAKL